MNTLQKIYESTIREQISFQKIGTELIQRKLKKQGVSLNQEQLKKIENLLENIRKDEKSICIELDEVSDNSVKDLSLDLSDPEELKKIFTRISENIEKTFPELVSKMTERLLKALEQSASSMLEEHREVRERFEANINLDWKKPLNLMEMFLVIVFEAGEDFNREFRTVAARRHDFVFEALTRLHARGCQIASEVLTLLRSGYADGAHARWRTLYEVAIAAQFIAKHGNGIAEQYLLHDAIESGNVARKYQEHCLALKHKPIPKKELGKINAVNDALVKRFGASFKGDYGWAASAVGKDHPKFSDVEQNIGLQHWRPYYRMASHNIHANPKGVFFKLGLIPGYKEVLLAGPSNTGFADPGHGTVLSLLQLAATLLLTRSNLDRLVLCNILVKLEKEIGDAFLKVQSSVERRERTFVAGKTRRQRKRRGIAKR